MRLAVLLVLSACVVHRGNGDEDSVTTSLDEVVDVENASPLALIVETGATEESAVVTCDSNLLEDIEVDEFEGSLVVGAGDKAEAVRRGELAALGPGKRVVLSAGPEGGRAILVAGRPLREPVAKYGPFVMNTDREIVQAIEDYQAGRF